MSTGARKPWTGEELVRLREGWCYEIDEGELVIVADVAFYSRLEVHDPTEPDLIGRAQGEHPRTWSLAPSTLVGEPVLPGSRFHPREVFD